ncbi:MAG: heavy metal translocating P-type ATPase metal-binding domain-containing protein, partial [Gammaproteobacteria bacterium]|nr:heavy metal translocating P-type ATPase metal-binding domain-containing protein [Gammaproteobacteria bacterium]
MIQIIFFLDCNKFSGRREGKNTGNYSQCGVIFDGWKSYFTMHNTDTTIQPDSFRHEGSPTIDCFHCGLPVPNDLHLSVDIFNKPQAMCCAGCQAVAQTIIDAGLEDFYQFRTENSSQGLEIIPDFLRDLEVYDDPEIQNQFVSGAENSRE